VRPCGDKATRFLFGAGWAIVIQAPGAGRRLKAQCAAGISLERVHMPFVRRSLLRSVSVGVVAMSVLALGACGTPRLFGRGDDAPRRANAPAIGVNGYLWRATLDTLSFMPLASADPYGGVIITDWYSNPEKPDERFKATVYILDSRLRADGLNVAVFKQNRDASGNWVDAPAAAQTETDIENAILTRARQLRLSNIRG
jgi:hypothetical protein